MSSSQASRPLDRIGPFPELLDSEIQSDPQSYREILSASFAKGVLPDLGKLTGVAWSGRCFRADAPNTPNNAGYQFRVAAVADVGPIAQEIPETYEASSYWQSGAKPSYYDTQTVQTINRGGIHFNPVKIAEGAISIQIDAGTASRLRLSGKYLIEETTDPRQSAPRQALMMCYYFIPEYK